MTEDIYDIKICPRCGGEVSWKYEHLNGIEYDKTFGWICEKRYKEKKKEIKLEMKLQSRFIEETNNWSKKGKIEFIDRSIKNLIKYKNMLGNKRVMS